MGNLGTRPPGFLAFLLRGETQVRPRMAGSRFTEKKRKFCDAALASCKEPGNLATADIQAAAKVAGYGPWKTVGYRMIASDGTIKDDACRRYLEPQLVAVGKKAATRQQARAAVAGSSSTPTTDYEYLDTIATQTLIEIVLDDTASHGARVRASELLKKAVGKDRPDEQQDEMDEDGAQQMMLVLLGLSEVPPENFTQRPYNTWML